MQAPRPRFPLVASRIHTYGPRVIVVFLLLVLCACSQQKSLVTQQSQARSGAANSESSPPAGGVVLAAAPATATDSNNPDVLTPTGHTATVRALAFSPDGKWLASGGEDKTVIIWDTASGEEKARVDTRTTGITQVAFSPDGRRLASAESDGELRLWAWPGGTLIYSLDLQGWVKYLAYSSDGAYLAVALDTERQLQPSRIEILRTANGNKVRTFVTEWDAISALTITSDGRLVASGSTGDDGLEGSVRIWDLASGQPLNRQPMVASAFSADGKFMASMDFTAGPRIILWDLASGRQVYVLRTRNPKQILFNPNGREIVVMPNLDEEIEVWSVVSGAGIRTLPRARNGVPAAALSWDGKLLATSGHAGNAVKIWDYASAREVQMLGGQSPAPNMQVASWPRGMPELEH